MNQLKKEHQEMKANETKTSKVQYDGVSESEYKFEGASELDIESTGTWDFEDI